MRGQNRECWNCHRYCAAGAGGYICRLAAAGGLSIIRNMPSATSARSKKVVQRRVTKKGFAHGIKAAPGNPFAGLEHVFGSIALPRDPRPPREIIRARILADHNT